ncbi:hypothetical protein ScPMuIL_011938 [Solemya velum]
MSTRLGLRYAALCIIRSLHRQQRLLNCRRCFFSTSNSAIKSQRFDTEDGSAKNTVDEAERQKFVALSQVWWDEGGEFDLLHAMNDLRVPMVRDAVTANHERLGHTPLTKSKPLANTRILDVGCGGGILSEPLARLGASVTGIDMVEENIKIAESHLSNDIELLPRIQYRWTSPEELLHTDGQFDVVVASEVAEHVSDLVSFIEVCGKLVKPGGSFFLTTINKTWLSYALALTIAERFMKIVPVGTHDYEKLVPPSDLQYLLEKNNFAVRWIHGMFYNPLTGKWSWTRMTNMNYALQAVKAEENTSQSEESSAEQT